jgi:hypothetical protein
MTETFSCPNCGGALEYGGAGRTMKCPYCGTTVQVPEQMWSAVEQAQTASQWKKYVIIFLIITVGLPTCLSLLGLVLGLLGIGAGILAPILAFFLHFLVR